MSLTDKIRKQLEVIHHNQVQDTIKAEALHKQKLQSIMTPDYKPKTRSTDLMKSINKNSLAALARAKGFKLEGFLNSDGTIYADTLKALQHGSSEELLQHYKAPLRVEHTVKGHSL